MNKAEIERTVQQSLLDRLIDLDPRSTVEAPQSESDSAFRESVKRLKDSLRRDLEWLLNTRRTPQEAAESLVETRNSLYHYGVPDISSMSRDSKASRERLRRFVEESVSIFEPRLTDVRVVILEGEGDVKQELRFLIEGLLRMEPNPEQVAFDTVLEFSSGDYHVKGDGGGA
jgi:type VI secretion system protein ImpF